MPLYSKAAGVVVAEVVLSLATVGLSQGSAAEVAVPKLEIRLPKEEFLEGEPIPFTCVLPETDAAPDSTIVLTSRFRARLVSRVRGYESQGKSAGEWVPVQLRNRLRRVGEANFATYIPRCGSLRESGREIPPLLEVKLEVAGDWRCDRITLSQTGLSNTFRIRAVSRDGIPQEYCRLCGCFPSWTRSMVRTLALCRAT